MIYLQLFVSFCKIGFTSFGGMSMIPLINSEMLSRGWMSESEILDIVAVAEMTPGPLGINCATFAGMRTAGVGGAFIANLGVAMPTLTLCALVAYFFERFKDSHFVHRIMYGVRPITLGIILGALVQLGGSNFIVEGTLYIPGLLIALAAGILLYKYKWRIPGVILVSGVLGLAFVR